MEITGKVVVVTGGGNGIGAALATRFAERGAAGVVVADLDGDAARRLAGRIGGLGVACDVGDADAIAALVAQAEAAYGPVDVFCSNAGYSDPAPGDVSMTPAAYRRIVDVRHAYMSEVLADWSATERATLARLVDRLVDDLKTVRFRPTAPRTVRR